MKFDSVQTMLLSPAVHSLTVYSGFLQIGQDDYTLSAHAVLPQSDIFPLLLLILLRHHPHPPIPTEAWMFVIVLLEPRPRSDCLSSGAILLNVGSCSSSVWLVGCCCLVGYGYPLSFQRGENINESSINILKGLTELGP